MLAPMKIRTIGTVTAPSIIESRNNARKRIQNPPYGETIMAGAGIAAGAGMAPGAAGVIAVPDPSRVTVAPHFEQKRALLRFDVPHCEQKTLVSAMISKY